jgi:hypothetical protein
MPCLNEARTVAAYIEAAHLGCQAAVAARNAGRSAIANSASASSSSILSPLYTYEIVIADNGSTDGSAEIAVEHGARVVHVEQKGYGAALLGGIAAARGKYIVMGDSDSSYDFGEVPRFLDKLEEGFDLVIGNRFAGGIESGAMPWHHRYIGNPVLSGIGRLLYHTPCRDWHCGLRAFDRPSIDRLNLTSTGMEFASQMIIEARKLSLRLVELPTALSRDGRNRASHLNSFRDGFRHLALIAQTSWPIMLVPFVLLLAGIIVSTGINFDQASSSSKAVKTLTHDLGIIAPNSVKAHVFSVLNDSDLAWTVKEFKTSCRCTIGEVDKRVIEPGEAAEITISYSAPAESKDETRKIALTFLEPNSPRIVFAISASIRRDMVLESGSLTFKNIPRGASKERRMILKNFGDKDWKQVVGNDPPGWLEIRASKLERPAREEKLREIWALDVEVRESELKNTTQDATIQLTAIGDEREHLAECKLKVITVLENRISVAPQELLFSSGPDGTSVAKLAVTIPKDIESFVIDQRTVEHSLGDALDFEISRVFDRLWTISFQLRDSRSQSGSIRLVFDKDDRIDVPFKVIK